jgi:site-specific DNA recombinase
LTEQQIHQQVMALFKRIKQRETVRDWFTGEIRKWATAHQQTSRENISRIQRDVNLLREQQAKLLNLRLLDEIDADTFANKNTELRDRIAAFSTQLEAIDRNREEQADLALQNFQLSQSLTEKWLTAEFGEKRKLVEIVVLNFSLDGATLVPTMNKPFDILLEGLEVPSNRGDKI